MFNYRNFIYTLKPGDKDWVKSVDKFTDKEIETGAELLRKVLCNFCCRDLGDLLIRFGKQMKGEK